MPSLICSLLFLILTNFFIESATSALPNYLQNLELDDITSLLDRFPVIISKIKEAVNRLRCPKGWRRLGGSCYYLSDIKSLSTNANYTCHSLHSNHSNLMQISNTVELFYAAHVLTKNNLSSIMIEIDPNLLKGKKLTEILMNDQDQWQRVKKKVRQIRTKYYKLKEKILQELKLAGLRISKRSKKIKQSVDKYQQKYMHSHINLDSETNYDYHQEQNVTDHISLNDTTAIDEYEYDSLDSSDEDEIFEEIDDIQGICDKIDWNVLNNDSTVYILTTYLISNKIICSLSNIESLMEYQHICEYVLDFCFANVMCGKHGRCVNTLSGFKCSCSFLYGGLLCEKISKQGRQIIIGLIAIAVFYGLSIKPIRWTLSSVVVAISRFCKRLNEQRKNKKLTKKEKFQPDQEQLMKPTERDNDDQINYNHVEIQEQFQDEERRQTIAEEIITFLTLHPLQNPNKRDLFRTIWVGVLTIFFLLLLFSMTTLKYFASFTHEITDDTNLNELVNETIRLVTQCERISDSYLGNLVFFPIAVCLIIIFSWSVKREQRCLNMCDGRPGLIPPIEPFRTSNRITTATVFGILAFEVLKIFEELLFGSTSPINRGVLVELIERIGLVILVGLRYYPILASLQLRNILSRFFICLYVLADMIVAIIREGSCMGFVPLSGHYSPLQEATLRVELGTWFIIYGLIKTTPHFIFLSYISAELWIRFVYDAVYVPRKKNKSIWLAPIAQFDESEFAKYYVTKLFRRNYSPKEANYRSDADLNIFKNYKREFATRRKVHSSFIRRILKNIYDWEDHFRYTTLATCSYTVAFVFLYYLACTFVFLYISRTTGYLLFLRYYLRTVLNIELKGIFSLRLEIILSAIITFMIYGGQLYLGMKNYKKHKLDLYRGIYEDVPSAVNFTPNSIVSKSVHYSGFLVGYLAWGFIISFHLILLILCLIRIISLQMRYIELILAVTVPITVVYLLKMITVSTTGKFLFMQDMENKLNLDNRKTYAIFVYFNFFADCFLGIAACIFRFIKATALNLVYMARLDCSFLGRPLEKFDFGFAAYVSYLHMEVAHTNPIMLAFCYQLYDDAVKRRKKQCYDDECCIAPGELNEEATDTEQQSKMISSSSSGGTKRSQEESLSKDDKKNKQESIGRKQNSISADDDNNGRTVRQVTSKTKSPSSSSALEKSSQKSKARKSSIEHDVRQDNDEEEEEDGGPPKQNISSIARLIPEEQPTLPQPSVPLPSAIPRRDDLPAEEDDNEDNFDDDGGLKVPSTSTVSKLIPENLPLIEPLQQACPPPIPKRDDIHDDDDDDDDDDEDEDDDGGIDPKTIAKHRREREAKKKKKKKKAETKKENQSILVDDDDDDDDDGTAKQHQSNERKKSTTESQAEVFIDDDVDEDGGPVVETYDTIRALMTCKKPTLVDTQTKTDLSPEFADDGSMLTSRSQEQPKLASYNTISNMVSKISRDVQRIKEQGHYDTIPTDEERLRRANDIYSPPSYGQVADLNTSYAHRRMSYREAQQRSPPLIQRRSIDPSLIRTHSNINEDSSYYSEIRTDTTQSDVVNRSYSHKGSTHSSLNHSVKQKTKHSSEQTLKEEQPTEESVLNTEQEEDDNAEAAQEEEKEDVAPKSILEKQLKPIPNISTAFPTVAHLVDKEGAIRQKQTLKQKRARFRWFLAYTIINNYHLFDLRKQVQSRLALLRIQRSNLIDEEKQQAPVVDGELHIDSKIPQSTGVKQKKEQEKVSTPISVKIGSPSWPAGPRRHLSVPVTVLDNCPQSPAEQYIATCCFMLYGENHQQTNTLSFQRPLHVMQSSLDPNIPGESVRPPYARQDTCGSKAPEITEISDTPIFQPMPESIESTANYAFTSGSSNVNFPTLRTQMSHAQHMEHWRQYHRQKFRKRRPHCYIYGSPPQQLRDEKISMSAILTPRSVHRNNNPQRLPSQSPFRYPQNVTNINEGTKTRNRTTVLPSQAENTDREKTVKKKTLRTTVTTVDQKESSKGSTTATEV